MKCFSNESDKINSGIYTSRKKARTIYRGGLDLAKHGGVYHKSTNGQQKGTYVGDVKVSQNGSRCLNGASSYETLLSVTQGKYLESPDTFDLRTTSDIWTGNLYVMDLSGTGLHTIDASAGGIANTFAYPPDPDINNTYPTKANGNGGLVVDPCFNVFYPDTVSTFGTCYLKNERAYQKNVEYINYANNRGRINSYIQNNNGYTGSFAYPQRFIFDCCSNPMVVPPIPGGGGGVTPSVNPTPAPAPAPEPEPEPSPDALTKFTLLDHSIKTIDISGPLTQSSYTSDISLNTISSVVIGNTVTDLSFNNGLGAFQNCSNLISITIPASVTSIGDQTFYDCSNLSVVTIEADSLLNTIGYSAFYQASSLTSIIIPKGVSSIGTTTFYMATSLTTVTFEADSQLTTIGHDAFFETSALTSITIPKSVTSIGINAFYKNSSLATVTFEADSSLNSIGAEAFNETPLTSITIPSLVTNIGSTAFIDCSSLSQVTFTGNMIPPDISGTIYPTFPPISQNITAYYTQDLSQNYIDILEATFKYVIGPDLFSFLDSPTLGTDYTYLVQNGSSSVSDKYSIISVLPTSLYGVKFTINPGYGTDYGDFQVGVVLVGAGETPGPSTYSGGKGGASIYATLSATDISNNTITLQSGTTNVSGDPYPPTTLTSMEISNVNTTWTCGHTLDKMAGGSNITYTQIKESSTGGSAGYDSGWIDSIDFMDSSISLPGYGGGGGSGTTVGPSMPGSMGYNGQSGQNGKAGQNGEEYGGPFSTYLDPNGAAGTGTGGGGSGSQSLQTTNYSTPGTGGSGLAYFYIGFKAPAPTTP